MIEVRFDRVHRCYAPGDPMVLYLSWDGQPAWCKLKLSLRWFTVGKGSSMDHVWLRDTISCKPVPGSTTWSCRMPRGPLSLEGRLLRIQWCVEIVAESNHDQCQELFTLTYGNSPIALSAFSSEV